MSQKWIVPVISGFLIVVLALSAYRDRKQASKMLHENERLVNENRDLQQRLTLSSRTAQQIADRKDMQQQVQGQFVDRREYFRKNWKQYISVNTGDYKTGFLGGIKNLQITVRNQTEYPLDNAVVKVEYLRGNGNVFKTEQYTVHNIPEKGAQSIPASNSRKGMKVNIKLVSVTSQPLNFCWAADKKVAPNDPDPWACVPAK
ncbi:hypothetical protein GFS24_20940 [Chitinophaga sp. SYP-B3965]|uniref:hypothetical protein n=1 Tax=Chitinophaga sp. SYP-B3965 TaxID=2663120 RepID=UPI001299E9D7|nr:hypothetical protein [Chitinophaga sp. SYP-B3965]MRG47602.1 hypothetical protein [Chitinophaga sp. SYP-B3965]